MPTKKGKFYRFRPGAVVQSPMELDPAGPTRPGLVGSDLAVEGARKKSVWFDYLPLVTILPAMVVGRWVEVYRQSNFILPSQRGLVFVFFPWLAQPGSNPEGGPLVGGGGWGGSMAWRICSRGAPIPGWERVTTINLIWGFVSPVPLLEFWQEDSLSIECNLTDPAPSPYVGGTMGARLAGRIVPR